MHSVNPELILLVRKNALGARVDLVGLFESGLKDWVVIKRKWTEIKCTCVCYIFLEMNDKLKFSLKGL